MMKNIVKSLFLLLLTTVIISCSDDEEDETPAPTEVRLIFKFKFDSTQVRLDGFGSPSALPPDHGGQSPRFNKMSSHYIEMAQSATTLLGNGAVLYHATETTAGGSTAIDFSQSIFAGNNETFFSVPLKDVAAGTYQYLRVSLAYQNYDVNFRVNVLGTDYDLTGTVASLIGFNTYLTNLQIKDSALAVNGNRKQGFWAFETHPQWPAPAVVDSGQSAGTTTVPNPINSTSPIPAGSCVVTGAFTNGSTTSPLVITGNETSDIVITVSLSTNKSFEWVEHSTVNYYEPLAGDSVVDMGIRGLIPIVN